MYQRFSSVSADLRVLTAFCCRFDDVGSEHVFGLPTHAPPLVRHSLLMIPKALSAAFPLKPRLTKRGHASFGAIDSDNGSFAVTISEPFDRGTIFLSFCFDNSVVTADG